MSADGGRRVTNADLMIAITRLETQVDSALNPDQAGSLPDLNNRLRFVERAIWAAPASLVAAIASVWLQLRH
ncbi:MAG: hypothetical protein LC640_09370 [Frankia sp.]|nr:hypothetical protein [Frankia sp.]